jgi:lipid A ethanolaminephosphotransferase
VLLLFHVAVLALFSGRYVIKPLLIGLFLLAAAGSHFSDRFGAILDRSMIENVFQTTPTEAGHLMTPEFIRHMLLFGIAPSALILWPRLARRDRWTGVRQNLSTFAICLGLAIALVATQFSFFAPMWREQRTDMMSRLIPAMPIVGAISYGVRQYREIGIVAQPYGTDARIGPALVKAQKPALLVLVVGETARAQNFGLNGYARDTTPELRARDAIAFTNVTSCGTATAVSLPCMFSHLGRANYSNIRARGSENLIDVLTHAGLSTAWWENNTGSKSVADRIPRLALNKKPDLRYCAVGECHDDILVDHLRDQMGAMAGNTVLVLHTGGSHGPAYYLRYPDEFRRFTPDCRTAEISDCSNDELINAYDNSILFTDHVLASIIDVLKANESRFSTAMLYVSDHGESLGENNMYLHGLPYFLAPDTQTHVPMVTWMSNDFARTIGLDTDCLRARTAEPLSHDNLFDTVLGLMDVQTSVYRPELDAFAACRTVHAS